MVVPTNINADIFGRIVDTWSSKISPEAAKALLQLDFVESDRDRMNNLATRARDGTLSAEEDQELTHYIHAGHLLGILHSKARMALRG